MAEDTGPERRIVSVLFADLVGFTALSEQLDPEDIAAIQDAYFAGVREAVTRYGGRLEKFIGDAAVGAFGVPRTREDDAERAVRAGLALLSLVESLSGRLGLPEGTLRLRVGVNTGEVAVAVGGPDHGRLTGDVMNVSARLQGPAEPGTVLCGQTTSLSADPAISFGPPIDLELKGKSGTVRASQALAVRADPSRDARVGRLRAPTLGRE